MLTNTNACFVAVLALLTFVNCSVPDSGDIPLDKVKMPKGFKIDVFAKNVDNARSMSLSPSGTLFVGTRRAGKVYAIVDKDKDYKADKVYTLATGLNMPNGVAFRNGDLYVAEVNRVIKFPGIESRLDDPPPYKVINDDLPSDKHHGWKFIEFGPDGKLYVPVGAPCNICNEEENNPIYASIARMDADGRNLEVYAHGVRNTVGFTWHPDDKSLWFTDNGRDMLGDELPADELNRATKKGMHFGYPYCHQGDTPDPELAAGRKCSEFVAPALNLGAHVAALGLRFYKGDMFPKEYKKSLFIAFHGSWNRSEAAGHVGYRVVNVKVDGDKATDMKPFARGWLNQDNKSWGRPVDVQELPDGSLLVSDDKKDVIYRITYKKP